MRENWDDVSNSSLKKTKALHKYILFARAECERLQNMQRNSILDTISICDFKKINVRFSPSKTFYRILVKQFHFSSNHFKISKRLS